MPYLPGLGAEDEPEPFSLEQRLRHPRDVRILAWQQSVDEVEHLDHGAQAGEGLSQLQADRAGTDDDQVGRLLLELEDGLVGQIGDVRQSRYRRDGRPTPRADDHAARLDRLTVDAEQAARTQPGPALTAGYPGGRQ